MTVEESMTAEEALKYHLRNSQTFTECFWDGDEENNPYATAFRFSIQALKEMVEYRPHDLRKDPSDLPEKEYDTVEVFLKNGIVDIAVYNKERGFTPWYAPVFQDVPEEWEDKDCVIAWRKVNWEGLNWTER